MVNEKGSVSINYRGPETDNCCERSPNYLFIKFYLTPSKMAKEEKALGEQDRKRIEQEVQKVYIEYVDYLTLPKALFKMAEYEHKYQREQQAKEIERLRETLSEIRHALYDRDTDDAILDCIAKHLDEAGFPYESED